ncbi:sugar porter family MFS transporter [Flagellimonas pacifica]|uniref:MFS transporter, SP family, arabinose:H+ symporter n=1 Tax=Flagellimonas pacifica TaxID=1247520 RepID=A0A285MYZ6_9FLAO|nr:sugar porter family MFS transporter [Allomuricauda parva]SNZ01757.1 MFS transporter, SP family, arabinose:H+ symporter [Allomuricauda parva]
MNLSSNGTHDRGNLIFFIIICIITAFGGFLFGFDTAVISGAISPLTDYFELGDQPVLLGWTVSSVLLGSVLGAAVSGMADNIGRKNTLIIAAILFTISALGSAIVESLTFFIVARLIGGFGVGMAAMVVPLYISEVSPPKIRGRMVSMYQLSITVGVLMAYFTNEYFRGLSQSRAFQGSSERFIDWIMGDVWRVMLGSELIPSFLFLILLFMVPRSPRFAMSRGKKGEALKILAKINGKAIAQKEIVEIEQAIDQEKASFAQLFKPGLKKATFIALFLAIISQLSGIDIILHYGPLIMERAGLSFGQSLYGQIVFGVVLVLFTLLAMWKVDQMGRKKLLFIGNIGVFLSLAFIGYLFSLGEGHESALIITISIFIASFSFSLGPIPWIIMSEIFPTKVRGRAMALGTLVLFGSNWLVAQLFPWLSAVLGEHGVFWLLAAISVLTFPFIFKVLPETKGKSLEEIENYWEDTKR